MIQTETCWRKHHFIEPRCFQILIISCEDNVFSRRWCSGLIDSWLLACRKMMKDEHLEDEAPQLKHLSRLVSDWTVKVLMIFMIHDQYSVSVLMIRCPQTSELYRQMIDSCQTWRTLPGRVNLFVLRWSASKLTQSICSLKSLSCCNQTRNLKLSHWI